MSDDFFIFKGLSSKEFNIIVNSLPPISKPQKRVIKELIDGRNGYLTTTDESYEGIVKSVEFHLDNFKGLDELKKWLNGTGKVVFSNEIDRYYKANIINQFDFTEIIPVLKKAIIQFECQPFGYLLSGEDLVTTTEKNFEIINQGNIYSKPYMKLYGSGDISITINGRNVLIEAVSGYVEIDSELDSFYKSTESMENNVTGECPIFEEGVNTIILEGNITKTEIIPRWCCL